MTIGLHARIESSVGDPDLVVHLPPRETMARRYITSVILTDWLGLRVEFVDGPPGAVILESPWTDGPGIRVPDRLFSVDRTRWPGLLSPSEAFCGLDTVDTLSARGTRASRIVPRLFHPVVSGRDSDETQYSISHDVFGVAFYFLAGCGDWVGCDRDRLGRQRFAGSILDLAGAIERPVVDHLVDHLWMVLQRRYPFLRRRLDAYSVWPTHDVDYLLSWLSVGAAAAARSIVGDLVKRRDVSLAARRGAARIVRPGALSPLDPFGSFEFLMDASESIGARSSFFFLPGGPSPLDHENHLDSRPARDVMKRIGERGHEVGVHGSAAANDTPGLLARQREQVSASAGGAPCAGGRQHYLTWRAPVTWRLWDEAGLSYDSSLAFIETVGFRAGTARPFRVFDLDQDKALPLVERPLIAHDTTLSDEMGLVDEEALECVASLADQCRDAAGTLTLLWHNTSFQTRRSREWYLEMLRAVA